MNVVEILNSSGIKALERKSADLAKWSKCKHNKDGLELYLQFHIVELVFKHSDGSDGTIFCTSNLSFIKAYSVLKSLKKDEKLPKFKFIGSGIRTADPKSINTWDLVDNKMKTIPLFSKGQDCWLIKDFVPMEEQDAEEILNVMRRALSK